MNETVLTFLAYIFLNNLLPPTYPPTCLYLSSESLPFDNLTQTNADNLCAQRTDCAGNRAFMSFPGEDIIDQYTCSDIGVYVCDTYIPVANSTQRAIIEPLYRRLADAGLNSTEYWSLTSTAGEYLACAVANTASNVYLFDWESIKCNGTRPVLCECIEPNSLLDELIVLTFPYFRSGDIAFSDGLARIEVDSWYVVSGSAERQRGVDLYQSGDTIVTNGSFSIERVNEYGPYKNPTFLQLVRSNTTFVEEYREGGINFTESYANDSSQITFQLPKSGLYETVIYLASPANQTSISTCPACIDRFCQCMLVLNNTIDIWISGYAGLDDSSRVSVRYIV